MFFAGAVVAAVGAVILLNVLIGLLWPHRVRFQARATKGSDTGILRLTLTRSDGQEVGYATCTVIGPDKSEMRAGPVASGKTVAYAFPDDFKETLPENIDVGRCRVRWHVSARGISPRIEWEKKPRAKSRFKITPAMSERAALVWKRGRYEASHESQADGKVRLKLLRHDAPLGMLGCRVSRQLSDGAFDEPFLGIPDPGTETIEGPEVALVFPDQFQRKVKEVRSLSASGVVVNDQYEPASADIGQYKVEWLAVSFVQGGAFAIEHHPTMDDFKREEEVAQDRFTLEGPE